MGHNANSTVTAAALSTAKRGTFTGLTIRKKGRTRGRGDAKLTYGDDRVHVCILTGFRYRALCERSLEELAEMDIVSLAANAAKRGVTGWEGKGRAKAERVLTQADFEAAANELVESLTDSKNGENTSTTDHVYDSLVVDGETVRGGRVYKCAGTDACRCRNCNPDDPKAPLPGTIYLQGLKIGETILEAAANGPAPKSKSSPKVVAKNMIRKYLPVAKYVSYSLEPGTEYRLNAGGTAAVEADEHGIRFDLAGMEAA